MNALRRVNDIVRSGCALVLALCSYKMALSQTDLDVVHGRSAKTLRQVIGNKDAKRIARERYQLVKRLESRLNFNVYSSGETSCTALFPAGISDRVYILQWNLYGESGIPVERILCCQQKNGEAKLVYAVNLDPHLGPPKIVRIKSMNDHLHSFGSKVKGALSSYARNDLATEREYTVYEYWTVIDSLRVYSLSDGEHPSTLSAAEEYDVRSDPLTGVKLKQGEFYRRFGLPVSQRELEHLGATAPSR